MCKTNDKNISPCKSSFAHEIHVSWLYYGDIKIRDCFVYEHILSLGALVRHPDASRWASDTLTLTRPSSQTSIPLRSHRWQEGRSRGITKECTAASPHSSPLAAIKQRRKRWYERITYSWPIYAPFPLTHFPLTHFPLPPTQVSSTLNSSRRATNWWRRSEVGRKRGRDARPSAPTSSPSPPRRKTTTSSTSPSRWARNTPHLAPLRPNQFRLHYKWRPVPGATSVRHGFGECAGNVCVYTKGCLIASSR